MVNKQVFFSFRFIQPRINIIGIGILICFHSATFRKFSVVIFQVKSIGVISTHLPLWPHNVTCLLETKTCSEGKPQRKRVNIF